MTQNVLIEKLVLFVNLSHPEEAAKLKKILGLCFGLSICHASMKLIGKLVWWEASLKAIAHWNGDITKLKQTITLPDAEKTQTLEDIFKRVLNYVVYYQQGVELASEDVETLYAHQVQVLDPKSNVFQITMPNNEIKTIKDREVIVGYFEKDELDILLRQEDVQQSIYIISDPQHAIAIGYQHPYWTIYDPDDNHVISSKQKIHKQFYLKSDLIKEIYNDLEKILNIEKASFVKDKKKLMTRIYQELIMENPDILLCALPLVARDTPDYIPVGFAQAKKQYKKGVIEDILAKVIVTTYQCHEKWTGLHYLARYAQKYLDDVLDLAAHGKDGLKKIIIASAIKNKKGVTGLQMVIQHAPNSINCILEKFCSLKNPTKLLNDALTYRNKSEKQKAWEIIKKYAYPEIYEKISDMLLNSHKTTHQYYLRNLINTSRKLKKNQTGKNLLFRQTIFGENVSKKRVEYRLENRTNDRKTNRLN